MTEKMSPGHVYLPRLGSGIEWQPGLVSLWEGFRTTATAAHDSASPYDYWRSLAFAHSFPDVTHWWFRSAWTQRARLTGIQNLLEGGTAWGYMQFIDESLPAQLWTMAADERPVITVPFPLNEVQPVNLPLRLALARLVAGVVTDQVPRDTWLTITSLVPRDELPLAFPDTIDALPWQLEGVDTSTREAFCRLQGLKPA